MASAADVELFRQYEAEVLDVHHTTLPFWSEYRSEAVFATLAQFDISTFYTTLVAPPLHSLPVGFRQSLKSAEEALSQSLRWLTCDGRDVRLADSVTPRQMLSAREFNGFASTYVDIADYHKMYGRGQIDIEVIEGRRLVRFLWPNETDFPATIRGIESLASQRKKFTDAISGETPDAMRRTMEFSLRSSKPVVEAGRLKLECVTQTSLAPFYSLAEKLQFIEYDFMPDEIELFGFSVGELRSFFSWFRAWGFALGFAFQRHFLEKPEDINHLALIPAQYMPKDEFMAAMMALTGLPSTTINRIVGRLRYDDRTSWPCVFLQPLIEANNHVAWSPAVIQATSYLRNMLRLMAKTPILTDHTASLIGERDRRMLQSLGDRLSRSGKCKCKLNTCVEFGAERTDLDLLAYNPRFPNELLLVEGKAVLAVDEINEVDAATEELKRGQAQLSLARDILNRLPEEQKRAMFRFVRWHEITEIYEVVVTPNTEPHQGFNGDMIPAISLATIDCKMRENHLASPRKFWERARTKPWLEPLQRYVQKTRPLRVGDVTYELTCGESIGPLPKVPREEDFVKC